MATSEDDIGQVIQAAVAGWLSPQFLLTWGEEGASELEDLRTSLLTAASTLSILVNQYKIALRPLLDRLRDYRLDWRFANPSRLFAGRTKAEIRRMPLILETAAKFLEDGGALFAAQVTRWRSERIDRALRGRRIDWQAADTQGRDDLVLRGGAGALHEGRPRDEQRLKAEVVRRSWEAALLLQRTAAKMQTWTRSRVVDEWRRPIFRRGPHKRVFEASALRDLMAYFRRETRRELRTHAGSLLAATLPSLRRWSRLSEKRMDVRVRELLEDKRSPRLSQKSGSSGRNRPRR